MTQLQLMYKNVVGDSSTLLAELYTAGDSNTITVEDCSRFPDAPNIITIRKLDETELVTVRYTEIDRVHNKLSGIEVLESDTETGLTAMYSAGSSVYRAFTKYDLDALQDNIQTLNESKLDVIGGIIPEDKLPRADKNTFGIVALGDGVYLDDNGHITIPAGTISEIQKNGVKVSPDYLGVVNITIDKNDVGLGNVDNTADSDKPVSIAVQTALNGKADSTTVSAHINDTNNPHSVTKEQIGLSNVDNTADLDKPVSDAVRTELDTLSDAIDGKVDKETGKGLSSNDYTTSEKTKLSGIATGAQVNVIESVYVDDEPVEVDNKAVNIEVAPKIDAVKTELQEQIDSIESDVTRIDAEVSTKAEQSTVTTLSGKVDDIGDAVTEHVTDIDNPHSVTKDQIGLGNVNNTSDLDKPVSTAVQEELDDLSDAIDGKVSINQGTENVDKYLRIDANGNVVCKESSGTSVAWGDITGTIANQTDLQTALNGKVSVISGKGLSTNDYTNSDKSIVDSVESSLNGKVDKVTGKQLSTNDYTNSDKSIVAGVPDIESDVSDLKETVSDIQTAVNSKVDKVEGKGLSSNDYADADKSAVDGIPEIIGNVNTLQDDVTELTLTVDTKVDKVEGKVLSSNDYTNEDKSKVANTYTKDETDGKYALKVTTINLHPLSSDIVLTATDVNALPDDTNIPRTLADLSDDTTHRVVTDTQVTGWDATANSLSLHTGNKNNPHEVTAEQIGVESGAQVNKIDKIKVNGIEQSIVSKTVDITVPDTVAWNNVTGKPETFTPSAHTHSWNEITGGKIPMSRMPVSTAKVTLLSTGWVNKEQTVSVAGVTADSILIVESAPESYLAYGYYRIRAVSQSTGTVTFTCEESPANNEYANIIIIGESEE